MYRRVGVASGRLRARNARPYNHAPAMRDDVGIVPYITILSCPLSYALELSGGFVVE